MTFDRATSSPSDILSSAREEKLTPASRGGHGERTLWDSVIILECTRQPASAGGSLASAICQCIIVELSDQVFPRCRSRPIQHVSSSYVALASGVRSNWLSSGLIALWCTIGVPEDRAAPGANHVSPIAALLRGLSRRFGVRHRSADTGPRVLCYATSSSATVCPRTPLLWREAVISRRTNRVPHSRAASESQTTAIS